ncbi:ABC transporter permease [Thiohalobacter sp. IOR34]|uniref:ABC transporter permease n=1 Tax=Thiohalobacter sp. IOR34 TaxID=3057176 RepID=UPI0025AF63A1|nr:ABC transporter permease [Thiohalobacter sp. IOR34]WJW74489.1 ABC transporter permease [Thiohalobacter sp. IOR34]
MIRPVILWTDALVFLLLAVVAAFVWYARGRRHLHDPWLGVIGSRMGMASLVVVLAYVLIGLLDSVHFRLPLPERGKGGELHYSGEVLSLLDLATGPLRSQVEKSYSAPFATHLYTKETIELPDGSQRRGYPRLRYGGAHLADPAQRAADIRARLLLTLGETLIAVVLLLALLSVWLARRHRASPLCMARRILRGEAGLPWRVFLVTSAVLLFCLLFAWNFAAAYHILGTDKVGEDVFYQSLKSIRTGLLIGTLTTLVMLPFAILLGIMAGYFRGWVDDVIQYIYTTLNSIPGVLLIAAAILILQVYMGSHPELFETMAERADLRLLFLCLILGVTSWTGLCRLLRGEAFKLREVDYIQAAQAFGVSHLGIILRHILPNVMHIVLISVVLDFSGLVLAEAVLSYVGVGVDPTMTSWGNMINRARLEMARDPLVWWSLCAAFLFMFTLVLAANLLADAVRDAFDPRLRRR